MNKKYKVIGIMLAGLALVGVLVSFVLSSRAHREPVVQGKGPVLVSTTAGLLTISNNPSAGAVITTNK